MHEDLVRWFRAHQRALPWRIAYDPYHVWVCEVMLQQTQVETALPYYDRFLTTLPSIQSLAIADEQEVLTLWAGLGYYSRARNLQAAAKIVVREHGGVVPDDYETLRTLPGIGQYMAGAIMSIAFNKPYPIVDGNVRRVLSMPGVSGEWRVRRVQDGNAGPDSGCEETSGDGSRGAIRGRAGKRWPLSHAKAKGIVGISDVRRTSFRFIN
jgi:A/G-specific adenine glycosylase